MASKRLWYSPKSSATGRSKFMALTRVTIELGGFFEEFFVVMWFFILFRYHRIVLGGLITAYVHNRTTQLDTISRCSHSLKPFLSHVRFFSQYLQFNKACTQSVTFVSHKETINRIQHIGWVHYQKAVFIMLLQPSCLAGHFFSSFFYAVLVIAIAIALQYHSIHVRNLSCNSSGCVFYFTKLPNVSFIFYIKQYIYIYMLCTTVLPKFFLSIVFEWIPVNVATSRFVYDVAAFVWLGQWIFDSLVGDSARGAKSYPSIRQNDGANVKRRPNMLCVWVQQWPSDGSTGNVYTPRRVNITAGLRPCLRFIEHFLCDIFQWNRNIEEFWFDLVDCITIDVSPANLAFVECMIYLYETDVLASSIVHFIYRSSWNLIKVYLLWSRTFIMDFFDFIFYQHHIGLLNLMLVSFLSEFIYFPELPKTPTMNISKLN